VCTYIDSTHDRIILPLYWAVDPHPDTVLGVPTKVAGGKWAYHAVGCGYGFGLVWETENFDGWPHRSVLLYARINGKEYGTSLSVPGTAMEVQDFELYQNYPNPFNPSTTIRYGLPNRSHVTLTVFNTLGQQVVQLVNREMEAGFHEVRFDGVGLSSGPYFYRIQAGKYVETKKLILTK
jgi:hypothetical protein